MASARCVGKQHPYKWQTTDCKWINLGRIESAEDCDSDAAALWGWLLLLHFVDRAQIVAHRPALNVVGHRLSRNCWLRRPEL